MSYAFFFMVGIFWGVFCGVCDAHRILCRDRSIMQLICGLLGYGVGWLLFHGQPEGGNWFVHLVVMVTVAQLAHIRTRARLSSPV